MNFRNSSECIVCFRNFDARYLHFDRITNWSNCRSLFLNHHATLVKLLVFSKDIFRAIVQISFLIVLIFYQFFWLIRRFCGLLYKLPLCFMEYQPEVMVLAVLNGSWNVMQFLFWYCANTFSNLSLVISKNYDVLKQISKF